MMSLLLTLLFALCIVLLCSHHFIPLAVCTNSSSPSPLLPFTFNISLFNVSSTSHSIASSPSISLRQNFLTVMPSPNTQQTLTILAQSVPSSFSISLYNMAIPPDFPCRSCPLSFVITHPLLGILSQQTITNGSSFTFNQLPSTNTNSLSAIPVTLMCLNATGSPYASIDVPPSTPDTIVNMTLTGNYIPGGTDNPNNNLVFTPLSTLSPSFIVSLVPSADGGGTNTQLGAYYSPMSDYGDGSFYSINIDIPFTSFSIPLFTGTISSINRIIPSDLPAPQPAEPTTLSWNVYQYNEYFQFTGYYSTYATNSSNVGYVYPYDVLSYQGVFTDPGYDIHSYSLTCIFTSVSNHHTVISSPSLHPDDPQHAHCIIPNMDDHITEGNNVTLVIMMDGPSVVQSSSMGGNPQPIIYVGKEYNSPIIFTYKSGPPSPSSGLSKVAIILIITFSSLGFLIIVAVIVRFCMLCDCYRAQKAERRQKDQLKRNAMGGGGGGGYGSSGGGSGKGRVNNYSRV